MRLYDMQVGERGRVLAVQHASLPFAVASTEDITVVEKNEIRIVVDIRGVRLAISNEVAQDVIVVRACR